MSSFKDLVKQVNSGKKVGVSYKPQPEEEEEDKNHSSFKDLVKKVNNGTIKVGSSYNSSQVDDWFKGVQSVYSDGYSYLSKEGYKAPNQDIIKSIDDYLNQASEVSMYLRANKNQFADYDSAYKSYVDSVSYLNSLRRALNESNSVFSQWKTEDDYKTAVSGWLNPDAETNETTVAMRKEKYESNQKRIAEIEAALPWNAKTFLPSSVEKWFLSKENDALMDELDALKAENNQYMRTQGALDSYYVPVTPEFTQNAAYRNYSNPTKEELTLFDQNNRNNAVKISYFDGEHYRDSDGNIVPYSEDPGVNDKLGLFLSATEDDIAEAYDRLLATNGNYTDTWADYMQEGDVNGWKYLTDYEISLYYDLYKRKGQAAAYEFLSKMTPTLTKRETQATTEWIYSQDGWAQFGLNVASIPMNVFGGVASFVDDGINIIQGEEINPYSRAHSLQNAASDIRNKTATDINAMTGNAALPLLGYTWGDVYQSVMSAGDSALGVAVGSKAYGVLMGMGAASAEMKDLYEQGASMGQIAAGGILAGAAEMVFEKYSIDKLVSMGDSKSIKAVIVNLLKQGGIEASEEMATEIANTITNAIVMGSQSDWVDAKTFAKNVVNAGISGFISGGLSGSVGATTNYVNYNNQAAKYGQSIIDTDGGVDALKSLAMEVAGASSDSLSKSLNKQVGKVTSETATGKGLGKVKAAIQNRNNAVNTGKLFDNVRDANNIANASQNRADVVKSLERKGIDSKAATAIAEAMVGQANGQQLTDRQSRLLTKYKDDVRVQGAKRNIVDNEMSTMGQRSQNIRNFETDIAIGMLQKSLEAKAIEAVKKQYTEKEFAPDGSYEVSVEGKAVDTKSGEAIDIKGVASISRAGMLLDIGDGKTIKASEVSYSNKNDALIYEAVANIGDRINAETANKLISQYNGGDAMAFAGGIRQAYDYGYYGIAKSELNDTLASELSQKQINAAYELGKQYRPVKDMADKANARLTKKPGEKGVYYRDKDGNATDIRTYLKEANIGLKDVQSTAIEAMEKMSKIMGVRFNVFESWVENGKRYYLNEDGVKTEGNPNGFYDPRTGEIYIDLHAGNNFEGTMLFTVAHELTHFMRQWSPAQFTKIAKIIFQHGEMKGSVTELVALKQANAKKNGRDISYDTALEELVADGMETILKNGNVVEFMADVKQKDHKAWAKLKEWFKNLAEFLKEMVSAYSSHSAHTKEGERVAAFSKKLLGQIEQIWAEGALDAGENYQAAMKNVVEDNAKAVSADEIITDGAVVTDGEGTKFSIKSMKHDIAEGQMFEDLKTYCGWTQKQVNELRNNLNALVEYMTPFRNILDMNESYGREGRRFSPYKPNSDPLYKISMDFSTLCSKRLLTQYVIENLQLRENRPMSAEEQMAIRDMLNEYRKVEKGLQVACAMCYVEAARLKSPKQIQKWLDDPATQMKNYFADKNPEFAAFIKEKQEDFKESRGYARNATKKDMSAKDVRELNKIRPRVRSQYQLTAEEAKIVEKAQSLPNSIYLTAANLANLSETDPTIYAAYTAFVRTATRSKSLETDEPYYYGDSRRDNGNGIIVSDSFIEAVNRENGMRFSSWSDWRIQHLLDYITAVIDNSVRGAAMYGYTKFGEEVRVLGKTGMMFNMSGVAGTQTGLNEDGSLSFSPTESMDVEDAIQLREEFPETAGLQCIGVSDDHIIALLRSDIIDYIIPYHVSGLNEALRRMADIYGWADYTSTQHAAIDKSIKFEDAVDKEHWHEEPVFSEFFVGYDTGMTGIEAMRESANRYVQMCKDRGLKPKFEQFAKEENYWKLLIDRKMINQKTGNLIKQKAVTPTFDFDTIKEVVDRYVANYDSGLEARALNHIVENWDSIPQRIKDLKKQGGTKAKKASKAVDTLANQTLAAQPTKHSDRDLRQDPLYPDTGREQSAFNRSYINKISGLKRNKERDIIIYTHLYAYHVRAVGGSYKGNPYLGEILKKIPIDNAVNADDVQEEVINGTYRATEEDYIPYEETPYVHRRNDRRTPSLRERLAAEGYDYLLDEPYEGDTEGGRGQGSGNWQNSEVKQSDRDNAPTFYSQMAKVVDGVKQEKLGAASVVNMLRGKGVKAEEIKWSGIETWLEGKKSVTKAELQEFIAGSMLEIVEEKSSNDVDLRFEGNNTYRLYDATGKVLDTFKYSEFMGGYISDATEEIYSNPYEIEDAVREEYGSQSLPRWSDYKLRGGSNYREIVFRLPNSSFSNQAMRVHWGDEAEGVLAHARIQDFDVNGKKMLFIEEIQSDWHNEGHKVGYESAEYAKALKAEEQAVEEYSKAMAKMRESLGTPAEAKLRREADAIQARMRQLTDKRFELQEQQNEDAIPDAPFRDTYHEYVLKRLIREAAEKGYERIGWTTADIQSERYSEDYAEGYRIEYDQDIPKFLTKYGKKWGTKVGKTVLDNGTEVWFMAITDSMKDSVLTEGQPLYSERVTDKDTLDFLNEQIESGEYITVYRSFQVIDGGLYAPMNAVDRDEEGKNKRLGYRSELGVWEKATESPEIAQRYMDKHPDAPWAAFDLDGVDNKTSGVAYNPYLHASNLVLNDQFAAAYRRNLVTVECRVPLSEVGAYHAKYAKDTTGWVEWKPGGVAGKLMKVKPEYTRQLFVSRYMLPVRIIPDSEVAQMYKEYLDGTNIQVPWNVVTPSLRKELVKAGVSISYKDVKGGNYTRVFSEIFPDDAAEAVRFQDRDTESVSNRSLLANAFEGIITNDIEKQKIQEYKGKVAMLDAEEKKLREINEQIKEMSFAKGPRDTKKITDLRFDAIQTANRIATLDKMLFRLEAATPLQNILKREKDMVRKREKQKSREALAEQKAAFEAKQKETVDKWRENRKAAVAKARETADKRDARVKLQKLVLDTVKWISYPAKTDVKCPDILKKPYEDFLKGIDLSSKRLANGGEATKNDLRLANAMGSLATALDKVMTAQDPTQDVDKVLDTGYLDLPANFVQKLRDMTENIKAMMVDGEYVVNTMTAAEVRQLSQMIRTLNHAIKTMSKLYANLRFANIEALGFDTMEFIDALGEIEKTGGVKDFVQWDNALPYYAFKRFGAGGESVFEGLMDAQDKLAFLAQKIFDFSDKAWTSKEAKAWSEDTHTIDLPNGNKLTLTTADAMSIYCLSRREQGLQHLLGGGTRVMGIQKGSKKAKDSRSVLTIEDISAITSSLTARQRAVAEAIQEFMSTTCSEWGNEISMKRFLTKEFNEKFYFPIESNDENLPTKDPAAQQSDLFRLLNISATKPLTPGANNEVIIRNIFDVFTGHASDMARLNAYGMALLDYMKWLNYREKTSNEEGQIKVRGVRKSMEQAFGNAAKSYVLNLVKDVNGRPSDGGEPNILMKWMRNAKTASVGSSLRVATLQITSYPRAALVLSPKNLALGLTKLPNIKRAKKYCGIALWKSFGFYDTNISRSIEDQMKGVTDVRQKLIELSLKGAEWGDAITWGCLWNACEYEVASTKKYKVGSEEFYQEVGKKLREVVYRTQVVDSTLTRSQMMRSKRGMAQEAAAFMSEPTLSANILMDAGFQFSMEKRRTGSARAAWKKTGKYIGRAVAVYSIGQLAAALLEGLWDAWRDDEDEEFKKKYLDAFIENLVLDLVPFNKIPIVSDVFEAVLAMFDVGFYSSDKMSTTWLTQAVSAVDAWKSALSGESSTTVYNALYKTTRAVSSFFGVSFSGVMREGVALWNNTAGAYDSTLKVRQYELSKGDLGNELYEAIVAGDTRQADSLKAQFEDQDSMHSAVRKALRENDPRIKEAAQAQINGDPSERVRIAREIIADGFVQDDVVAAITAEINAMTPDDGSADVKKAKGFYTTDDFATEIANGDQVAAYAAKVDIIETAQKNGKSAEDAEKSFNSSARTALKEQFLAGNISEQEAVNALMTYCGDTQEDADERVDEWVFEVEYGFTWNEKDDAYTSGAISAYALKVMLMSEGGMTAEEADNQIEAYDWQAQGYDATAAAVRDYNEHCAGVNVPKDVYLHIRSFANNTENDVDANGKTIYYSAMKKIMAEIDAQSNLTSAQKTAIARSLGWAEKNINKYKTW